MSATPTVATNVKSLYMGGDQPGTYKVVDADGNTVLYVDTDNEQIDIGQSNGVGFLLRLLKGLHVWEIKFLNDTACKLFEWWGIVVQLRGTSGHRAFHVQDGNGVDIFEVNNSGFVYFKPLASAPTTNVKEGCVYYDASASKLKVYTGSSWETISSS